MRFQDRLQHRGALRGQVSADDAGARDRWVAVAVETDEPLYREGQQLEKQGRTQEALVSYQQSLSYDSRSFHAWNGIGNARSCIRDFAGAVDAYTRALLVNSRSAVAWCNKAEGLIRLGHNRAALDALNEATEMDKGYTRAWLLKADVYDALGNVQEAQKARKRARPWGLKN